MVSNLILIRIICCYLVAMVSSTYTSSNQNSFSDLNNMITTLNQMDHLANQKISELAIQNVDQLQAEIFKGQNTLIGARKKTYFRTLFGTLLYDLSVLFGIAGSYWTTTYATTASVLDVVGQAVEEAAFDFEGLVELPEILPVDFSCLESFQLEMNKAYQLDNHQAGRSLEAQVQWSVDVVNFRINAEKSLSCIIQAENPTESRAIRGHLDLLREIIQLKMELLL